MNNSEDSSISPPAAVRKNILLIYSKYGYERAREEIIKLQYPLNVRTRLSDEIAGYEMLNTGERYRILRGILNAI